MKHIDTYIIAFPAVLHNPVTHFILDLNGVGSIAIERRLLSYSVYEYSLESMTVAHLHRSPAQCILGLGDVTFSVVHKSKYIDIRLVNIRMSIEITELLNAHYQRLHSQNDLVYSYPR